MQLRTEVEIDAPPGAVWSVLTNLDAYHEWNPFITSLRGELREGATLSVTIAPPESSELHFQPTLLTVRSEQELRWRGKVLFNWLFSGEHFFELSPVAGGQRTRLVHGEDFSGVLLRFVGHQLTRTARGFVFMNQALKSRVERERSPLS